MKQASAMSLEENRFCNFTYQHPIDSRIPVLKIYSDYAVIFRHTEKKMNQKSLENIEKANVKGRQYNGMLSPAAKRRITNILEAWLSSINYWNKLKNTNPRIPKRKAVFLTLTLSAPQFHSDLEIKRRLLVPFMQSLCKYFNVRYYFWRAEKQENGNIHFHLIIDQFIDKFQIQELWNMKQEVLGYITEFKKKHNHGNPPSTQIQSVSEKSDLVSYLVKYATKDESKLLVEGRVWGCSDELRNLQPFTTEIDSKVTLDLIKMRKSEYFTFVEKEHVTLVLFNRNELRESLPSDLRDRLKMYYLKIYSDLYVDVKPLEQIEIAEGFSEDLCVKDFEYIYHQERLDLDIFL